MPKGKYGSEQYHGKHAGDSKHMGRARPVNPKNKVPGTSSINGHPTADFGKANANVVTSRATNYIAGKSK